MNTFLLARKIEEAARLGVEVIVQFELEAIKFVVRTQGVGGKWYGDTHAITYEELHQCRVGDDPLWTSILERVIKKVLTVAGQAAIEDYAKIAPGPPHYTMPPAWHALKEPAVRELREPEWAEPEGGF